MSVKITPEQEFYSNFSKNVIILSATRKKINSQINHYLRKDDDFSVKIYTNIYLVIYSAWAEANLVKLVHTPNGFTLDQKKKILKDQDVLNKWKKCINTAFSKFRKNGSEIPNKKKKIHKLLDDYLKTQANIRNKIAHGQWVFPLYKNNRVPDNDIKEYIYLIDVIQIDTWFEILNELINIVLGLIDARSKTNFKAHYLDYYNRLTNIKLILKKREKFSIENKRTMLKLKPIPLNNNSE